MLDCAIILSFGDQFNAIYIEEPQKRITASLYYLYSMYCMQAGRSVKRPLINVWQTYRSWTFSSAFYNIMSSPQIRSYEVQRTHFIPIIVIVRIRRW